jgi:ElaB/YqjD/DUF883 family membrane-anchored ribosome-binding protein
MGKWAGSPGKDSTNIEDRLNYNRNLASSMTDKEESKIDSLGLDDAMDDLKVLAQKVSDMSKDLIQKASEQAEDATEKIGDMVDSTGDILISAGKTIKSTKKRFED